MIKTKEWRNYVSEGAGTFEMETVKKLFMASTKGRNGKPDVRAIRNKALAIIMLEFGAHPTDAYRMHQ